MTLDLGPIKERAADTLDPPTHGDDCPACDNARTLLALVAEVEALRAALGAEREACETLRRTQVVTLDRCRAITPSMLTGYLSSQGWTKDADLRKGVELWRQRHDDVIVGVLQVATDTEFVDYGESVRHAVDVLAMMPKTTAHEVAYRIEAHARRALDAGGKP